MSRTTGTYRVTTFGDERVKSFIPQPLPPANPAFKFEEKTEALHSHALAATGATWM